MPSDEKPYGRIYLITNTVNGKKYVGQTINTLKRRWSGHKKDANRHTVPLCMAIRKYGSKAFTIVELEQCLNMNDLNTAEKKWIQVHQTTNSQLGYNCTDGGDRLFTLTQESKQKIADSVNRSYIEHPDIKQNLSAAARRQWQDPVFKQTWMEQNRQKWDNHEERAKVSRGMKRYTQEHPEKVLPVLQAQREHSKTPEGRKENSERAKAHFVNLGGRGEWATEAEAKVFVQGLTTSTYTSARVGKTRPAYPLPRDFLRVYGKTFKEIRDGSRLEESGEPVNETTLRTAIQGKTQEGYRAMRKSGALDRKHFPEVGYFPRVYGKTFKEIRDGVKDGRGNSRTKEAKCV